MSLWPRRSYGKTWCDAGQSGRLGRAINLDGAEVSCNPPCLHRRKRPKTIILGGYSGLQVTGMIERFFGVWNVRFLNFLGYENFTSIFVWVAWWDFLGIQNNLKIRGGARVFRQRSSITWCCYFSCYIINLTLSGNFKGSEIRNWNFWGD